MTFVLTDLLFQKELKKPFTDYLDRGGELG
jgi:hypothetical protein